VNYSVMGSDRSASFSAKAIIEIAQTGEQIGPPSQE
jgi:hypothetical protein